MTKLKSFLPDQHSLVHVIDDDNAVLDSIQLLLDSIGIENRIYRSAQAFLDAYSQADFNTQTGCILMDIRMPIMSGIECQYQLETRGCTLPIIFVTAYGDVPTAVETMKHGAFDFIEKPYREQTLLDAIQKALLKNANEVATQKKNDHSKRKLALLTKREQQVLNEIIDGKANKVIANNLGLSLRTVELHRAHVMEKMEAKSLAELIRTVLDTKN